MSGRTALFAYATFPRITSRIIEAVSGGGEFGLSIESSGGLFFYPEIGAEQYFWPEWSGFPDPGHTSPLPVGTPYETRLQVLSGPTPSGDAVNAWITLDTNRTWFAFPTPGINTGSWRIQVRRIGGFTTPMASGDISFEIDV